MVKLRPARVEDLDAIHAITRDAFAALAAGHYSRAQLEGWMDGCSPATYREGVEAGRIQVAEAEGLVAGFVDARPGEVTRLYVLPGMAGRGIGKRLAKAGIALARQGHAGPVVVESLLNAVGFYRKLGFLRVGEGLSSHGTAQTPPIEILRMELPAQD